MRGIEIELNNNRRAEENCDDNNPEDDQPFDFIEKDFLLLGIFRIVFGRQK